MPIVKLCLYCNKPIDPKENYVEVRKEYQGNPQQIAHVACRQKNMQDLNR